MTTDQQTDTPAFASMSFVGRRDDGGFDMWLRGSHESYAASNDLGRRRAAELHDKIQDTGNPVLLGAVVQAMVAKGAYGPVEIGFCSYLGVALMGAVDAGALVVSAKEMSAESGDDLREERLRLSLKMIGYILKKSPAKAGDRDQFREGYMVVDNHDTVIIGSLNMPYDATLDDVEAFLPQARKNHHRQKMEKSSARFRGVVQRSLGEEPRF